MQGIEGKWWKVSLKVTITVKKGALEKLNHFLTNFE